MQSSRSELKVYCFPNSTNPQKKRIRVHFAHSKKQMKISDEEREASFSGNLDEFRSFV